MANIFTTLHPEGQKNDNLYPNIKKENIPNNCIDRDKLSNNVNSLLDSIGELNPSGVDTSINILAFTTNKGIYIGSDTGHWYYWNGTKYADGGLYQSLIDDDDVLNLSNEFVSVIHKIEDTIFTHAGYLKDDGTFDTSDTTLNSKTTAIIPCKQGDVFKYKGMGLFQAVSVIYYNGNQIVNTVQYNNDEIKTVTIPSGVNGVRFSSYGVIADGGAELFIKRIGILSNKELAEKIPNVQSYLENDISKTFYEHNGYLKDDGTFSTDTTIRSLTTSILSCKTGDVFYYKGQGQALAVSVLFYQDELIIGNQVILSNENYTKVVIPANVNGVVFSSFKTTDNPAKVNLSVIRDYESLKSLSVLNGKSQYIDYDNVEYYDSSNLIADKFIFKDTGALTEATGACTTDFIDITDEDLVYLSAGGKTLFSAIGFCIYDKNQAFIDQPITQATWNVIVDVKELLVKYPFAKYVRFSTLYQSTYPLTVYLYKKSCIKKDLTYISKLYKKKYYALGDSFTHGDFTGIENYLQNPIYYDSSKLSCKTYPYWIALRNNMNFHNLAENGANLLNGLVGNEKYKQVPADCDYCTLMIGLNDATLNNPIGTIDDNTSDTFYGCLNIMFSWFRTNRNSMHFGVLVLPNLKVAYRTALINASIKYGYPYLDFYNDPKVPAFMAINGEPAKAGMDLTVSAEITEANKVSVSNWHPSLNAHKFMSTYIEDFMNCI